MASWFARNSKLGIFLTVALPLIALRVFLVVENHVPMGHDTLQYLQLQYTFFNEAALRGSLPQWLPYMTQGTLSNFWIMISEGIFGLTTLPFAPLLKGVNFLFLFEAGVLFDELVLVLGCVLLASRYFKSPATVFFVTAALTFTSVSSTQIWWDFKVVYLLPLILYSMDRALREGSAKYLFFGGVLSVATLLGNLPYFAPPIAFGLVIFGLTLLVSAPRKTGRVIRDFIRMLSWRHALAVSIPAIFAALIFYYYGDWAASVVQANVGRSASGATLNVGVFLNYAGYTGPEKFLEFFGRYTNSLDIVVYAGILTIPFAMVSLFRERSTISYAFGFTALVLASFTIASYISVVFYYLFPLANIFREIGLFVVPAKVFLIFYAGFGFEAFWRAAKKKHAKPWFNLGHQEKITLLIPIVILSYSTIITTLTILWHQGFVYGPWVVVTENQLYLNSAQVSVALSALLALNLVYLVLLLGLTLSRKWVTIILMLILVTNAVDVFSMKAQMEYSRTPQVSPSVIGLFNSYNYNFSMERTQDYYNNSRFTTLSTYILGSAGGPTLSDSGGVPYSTVGRFGALYWNTESFVYLDSEASVFRTDFLPSPIIEFYRVWVPQSSDVPRHLGFPIPNSTVYQKATGFKYPKLQLFVAINILANDSDIKRVLVSSNFSGDMIFANSTEAAALGTNGPSVRIAGNISKFQNQRLNATIRVQEFNFDTLGLSVDTNSKSPSVLYYADAWDSGWHAYVNGIATPVIRTDLAYKSIILPPGKSIVLFVFGTSRSEVTLIALELLGIVSFLIILYLFVGDVLRVRPTKRGLTFE